VESARGEHRVGSAAEDGIGEVARLAGSAARDQRRVGGLAHGSQELQVVSLAGPIAVHRCEEDLTGAALGRRLDGPCDGIEARRRPPRLDHDLPAVVPWAPSRIDRDHHAL
jgi:hypothetical protein